MINSGDESGKDAGDKISDPLILIGDKIQKVTEGCGRNGSEEGCRIGC